MQFVQCSIDTICADVGRSFKLLCICVFCIFCIRVFDNCECHFWYPWTIPIKNIPYVFLALCHIVSLCICVIVYLCICIFCVFVFDTREYNFSFPWTIPFSKMHHMLGLSGTLSYAVFVYLYFLHLCVWHSGISCPWTILFFKIYHMSGLSGTSSFALFVYLCLCICVWDTWEFQFRYPRI